MKKQNAEKLAEDHWNYIEQLLTAELSEDMYYTKKEYIDNVGRHYKTALMHGFKHGREDV